MQSLIVALAFAASSTALVARQQSCCFDLTAHGSASGIIGQLSDGQNRIGGNVSHDLAPQMKLKLTFAAAPCRQILH